MTVLQLKLAAALAMDREHDLADVDDGILYGFGLPDFEPVTVSLRVVAKCMRWQCQCLDGSWNWVQFNEDAEHYRRNVHIIELTNAECRLLVHRIATARLCGGFPTWLGVEAAGVRLTLAA